MYTVYFKNTYLASYYIRLLVIVVLLEKLGDKVLNLLVLKELRNSWESLLELVLSSN